MHYRSDFHCVPIIIEGSRATFPLGLALTSSFVRESRINKIRIFYHESSVKSVRVPTKELGGEILMLPWCESDELCVFVDEILPQKYRITFTTNKLQDYWKETSIRISPDRVIYPIVFEAPNRGDISWSSGSLFSRRQRYHTRFIILQFSRVPPVGAIHRLPNEILHQIMMELRLQLEDLSSSLAQVCSRFRDLAAHYLAEPTDNAEKLRLLRYQPSLSRLWRTFRYTTEDVERNLDLLRVIRWSRSATDVRFEAGPVDSAEREKLLDQLAQLRMIQSITFSSPWTTKDIFTFVQKTHSNLRSLEVYSPALATEAADQECTRSLTDCNRVSFVRVPLTRYKIFASILTTMSTKSVKHSENQLQTLEIVHSFPLPPGLERDIFGPGSRSLANLKFLRLDCLPYQLSNSSDHPWSLSAPLSISRFPQLTHLILEGYNERSRLLPYNFFALILRGCPKELQYLSLNYCSIGFSHFREFCALFFRTARWFTEWDSKIEVVLFFGEWEEEEVAKTWGCGFSSSDGSAHNIRRRRGRRHGSLVTFQRKLRCAQLVMFSSSNTE
ncbi:hypothetical protein BT69DRAFT_1088482 [Atractiella rhizophila]|nr:hypothetical protein BT69DRAFT_1088482 [Atractiella rhizophila]